MLGSHLSIAGSMANALREAEALGLDCVQVFTKNQQQWKAPPLSDLAVNEWKAAFAQTRWGGKGKRAADSARYPAEGRVVSHASYLINLASPEDELWKKSIDLMTEEIERCERLGIRLLVHHPGSTKGGTAETGIARIAEAYRELFKRTRGYAVVSCLENTVGGGSTLGRPFEELAALRTAIAEATGASERVGFCFDTAHAHAGGYDLSSRKSADAVLAELAEKLGAEHIRVLHLNDSKSKLNSRIDRHEHIGQGTIGSPGFAAVMNHPRLVDRPKILETPKGKDAEGTPFDTLNVRRLRRLIDRAGAEAECDAEAGAETA